MISVVAAIGQCWFVAGVWTTYKIPLRRELVSDTHNALVSRSWIRPLILAAGGSVALIVVGITAVRHVFEFTHRQHVQIVAHRCGTNGFPENSLSGLKHSIALGAYAAELDVQLSKDGVVIVNHDKDLRRVANLPLTITDSESTELLKADIGKSHKPPLPTEPLPTLEQILKAAQGRICLSIELKYYGFNPTLAEKVIELLDRYPSNPSHEIISLEYKALKQVAALRPTIRRGFLVSASVGDVTMLDVQLLSISKSSFTAELLDRAQKRNMGIAVWTVNSEEDMFRLMVAGAELIVTDDPETALRVAKQYHELSDLELLLIRLREWLSK
jgi:glycerophosphoryl diester phosphodiesterase